MMRKHIVIARRPQADCFGRHRSMQSLRVPTILSGRSNLDFDGLATGCAITFLRLLPASLRSRLRLSALAMTVIPVLFITAVGLCTGIEARDMENEGIALIMQGKLEEGLTLMKGSIKLEPKNPVRRMNYASIIMAKGRSQFEAGEIAEANLILKEAEEHLLLAAKLFGNTPPDRLSKSQCYALLGDIYLYAFGQTEKALDFYHHALDADPANSSVKDILSSLGQ